MRSFLIGQVFVFCVYFIPHALGINCETIELAIVCMGDCTNTTLEPMLKSMLHHRQNPIHFNFVVDTNTSRWIINMIESWEITDLKCTFYNAEAIVKSKLRWIPNSHNYGIYGFVKLLLPDILPQTLNHVIILDIDLTFLCDIAELWSLFRNMTEAQFIGVTENLSDWYTEPNHWPALGRGYNSGVQLLSLHKIRKITDWNDQWRNIIKKNLQMLKHVQLVDQDVINVLIKENPLILYHINCQYNVQMGNQKNQRRCYENKENAKILHWNTPTKTSYIENIRDAEYFWDIYLFYMHMDINVLRKKSHKDSVSCFKTYQLVNQMK